MKNINLVLLICVLIKFTISSAQHNDTATKQRWNSTAFDAIKIGFQTIPGDVKEMGLTLKRDWKKVSIMTAGVAGLILVDKHTTSFYQDKIEPKITYSIPDISPKIYAKSGTTLWPLQKNDTYIFYSLAGLYTGSVLANYKKGQTAVINSVKASAYSVILTQLTLKTLVGRLRPDPTLSDGIAKSPYTTNPYNFGFFHIPSLDSKSFGTSFPSFHTTLYVTIAQVMAMEFNNYWIPYGIVSLIFFSDIKGHHHWISDMVAGGLIGGLIGTAVVKSTRKFNEKKNKLGINSSFNFQLTPSIARNYTGINFVGQF
jgi:membrane-associated phospholipid phosphatase